MSGLNLSLTSLEIVSCALSLTEPSTRTGTSFSFYNRNGITNMPVLNKTCLCLCKTQSLSAFRLLIFRKHLVGILHLFHDNFHEITEVISGYSDGSCGRLLRRLRGCNYSGYAIATQSLRSTHWVVDHWSWGMGDFVFPWPFTGRWCGWYDTVI